MTGHTQVSGEPSHDQSFCSCFGTVSSQRKNVKALILRLLEKRFLPSSVYVCFFQLVMWFLEYIAERIDNQSFSSLLWTHS